MKPDFDRLTVPADGEVIEITADGDFRSPEAPILPVAGRSENTEESELQQILQAATKRMGRTIHWLPIALGQEANQQYDTTLPQDSIDALRYFRIGIIDYGGEIERHQQTVVAALRDRFGLSTAMSRFTWPQRPPSPAQGRTAIDIVVFRAVTENVRTAPEMPFSTDDTTESHPNSPVDPLVDEPSDSSQNNADRIDTSTIESLVDRAMTYALDHDRQELTIIEHTDDSFPVRVREYLEAEYAEVILDESVYLQMDDDSYPDDEIVINRRELDEVRQDLGDDPTRYDVLITPPLAAAAIERVVSEVSGLEGGVPEVLIGDNRVVAVPRLRDHTRQQATIKSLASRLLAGCTLFEYIGWMDVANLIRETLAMTLQDWHITSDHPDWVDDGQRVDLEDFPAALINRLESKRQPFEESGVQTTPTERAAIKQTIAGVYEVVFEEDLSPTEIEFNQLFGEDEEADIYLPEVGINVFYWRRWSAERRLEVLLHEFAHVKEGPNERDHGEEFYERFVALTELAATHHKAIEAVFDESIDWHRLRRFIIESVHEETTEPDLETPAERQQKLRTKFDIGASGHY